MRSWLLPWNRSANFSLPEGPSKTYSFSIFTQGSLRRWRFNWSCSLENFFSLSSSFLRAASHCFCETTLRFSVPRTVLILGIMFLLCFTVVRSSGDSCQWLFVHAMRRRMRERVQDMHSNAFSIFD